MDRKKEKLKKDIQKLKQFLSFLDRVEEKSKKDKWQKQNSSHQ